MVIFTLSITAQVWNTDTKMSPWLLNKYEQQQVAVRENGGALRAQGRPVINYILALVESTDGDATIQQKGGLVWQDFGHGFYAAFLPVDSLGALDQSASIVRMEANELSNVLNDNSKEILGVNKVWNGIELPQAFRGNGVLAGVMDIGFDFTHPSFRNEDGSSRVIWFWDPLAENDNPKELGRTYTTPDEVLAAEHSYTAAQDNHGSHVLGSIAGRGIDGNFAGMAPEADIIGGHVPIGDIPQDFYSRLKDYLMKTFLPETNGLPMGIVNVEISSVIELAMLYKIFKKADELNKPCVVNWSFGAPSSFSADFTAYETVLNSMLGPGRIVVASAGNDGGMMKYVKKEADKPMEQPVYYKSELRTYNLYIRANMDNPFFKMDMVFEDLADTIHIDTYDAIIKNAFNQDYEASVDIPRSEWEDEFEDMEEYPFSVAVKTTNFAEGYAGFNLTVHPSEKYSHSENMVGKIIVNSPVELEFLGSKDAKGGYTRFSNENVENSRGCNIKTINFPGSLERIVTVGAMHQCTSFTNILGEEATYIALGSEEGHLSSFSSCGPTIDNRIKPDVVAPGHNILSVYNSFYEPGPAENVEKKMAYKANVFDKDYAIWTMSGTSMSSPVATGVIALWLQANPNLTPEDIKGVIQRTSHQPEPEFSGTDKNVYYGWGEIDAYAGLLDILGLTAIREISKHQPAGLKFRLEGHTLHIDGIDSSETVTVFDLSGCPVLRTETSSDGILSLPGLSAGVYAVQVGQRGSTLIRLSL